MKKKSFIIIGAIVSIMIVGSVLAYFTDRDKVTNSFTVGNIDVVLEEPSWNPEDGKDITPNEEIAKDPQVINKGVNDAYVFIDVTVPAESVMIANDDGSLSKNPKKHDLFSYEVNDGWMEIGREELSNETVYTYAYVNEDRSMKILNPNDRTNPIFDSVKFLNILEGELDNNELEIRVSVRAIQADNIEKTAPKEVLELITNGYV